MMRVINMERCKSEKNKDGVRCRLQEGHVGKHKYWSSLTGYKTTWDNLKCQSLEE